MSLPQHKTYRLTLHHTADDGSTLWLLDDNRPVCNLSEYGSFAIEGRGEVETRYSLRIIRTEEQKSRSIKAYGEKEGVIIEGLNIGQYYALYDISGRAIAQRRSSDERELIPAISGVYIVQVDEENIKVIVP